MNWPIGRTSDLRLQEDAQGKTAILDFGRSKKIILIFFVAVLAIVLIALLVSPTIKVNGHIEAVSVSTKIAYAGIGFLLFLFMYYIIYHPLYIMISRQSDGTIIATKRDMLFMKKTFVFTAEQNPKFLARKRRVIGTTIYVGAPIYQPMIRYSINGQDNDISLMFALAYFAKGAGPRGVVSKQQATDITNYLGLPLIFEE